MELTIDQALQKGVAAHKAGKLQEAEQLYRSILGSQPKHPDANHNLGVLAVGVGKAQEALSFFYTALQTNSKIEQFWLSYIDTLIKVGQLRKARQALQQGKDIGLKGEKVDLFENILNNTVISASSLTGDTNVSKQQISDLITLYSQNNLQEALFEGNILINQFPNDPVLSNILGAICSGLGKNHKAVKFYNRAIKLRPDYAESFANLGISLKNLGQYKEAISSYKKAIELKSEYAEAHNNLGNVFNELGKYEEAINSLKKAIALKSGYSEAHYNLGNALNACGQHEKAITSYSKAIVLKTNYPLAYNNRGNIFTRLGRYKEAISNYDRAIASKYNFPDAHNNKGNTLDKLGRAKESISSYIKAIELNTAFVEAYNNLGCSMNRLGRFEEAIINYDKAILLNPNFPEVYNNKGNSLNKLGNFQLALINYKRAIGLNSNFVEAHHNLGAVLYALGRYQKAVSSCKKAIRLKPNFPDPYNNLGCCLNQLGLCKEAIACYKMAIRQNPQFSDVYNNLGKSLNDLGKHEEAIANYNKAINFNPIFGEAFNNRGNAFNDLGNHKEAISSYNKAIEFKIDYSSAYNNKNLALNYTSYWSAPFVYKEHLKFEKQFGGLDVRLPLKQAFKKNSKERLRVGYVSPDFNTHSVAYFFEPLIENHTSTNVETFCYYNNVISDDTTRRLTKYSDHWRSIVGMNDLEAVQLIQNDEIDILVDLAGHTSKNRLLIFAQKPAPIQITWLGYPNTTGLSAIDYRFTDIIADPLGASDMIHSEKLIRLGNTFLCYKGNKKLSINYDSPWKSRGSITFASFNNLSKVTTKVIKVWSEILNALPNSRLLLKSQQLKYNQDQYFNFFEQEGVSKDRIELYGFLPDKNDHLALYNSVDICLDPFPFNGATTTCEALWMGVPVLTLAGDRHAGRVGVSLLTNLGLTNFIAQDTDDYIKIALEIADDKDYLKALRQGMRERMLGSPLCDGRSFANEVEKAYDAVWTTYINS